MCVCVSVVDVEFVFCFFYRIALVGFLLNVPGLLASFQHSVRFWSGNDVKVFFCR